MTAGSNESFAFCKICNILDVRFHKNIRRSQGEVLKLTKGDLF